MSSLFQTNRAEGSHNVRNVLMNAEERMIEIGFDAQQLAYLVGMSQECFEPNEFDLEVQSYLDQWAKEEHER
jgi:hypothetical protein